MSPVLLPMVLPSGTTWRALGFGLVAILMALCGVVFWLAPEPAPVAPPVVEVSSPSLTNEVAEVKVAAPVKAYKPKVKQQTALGQGLKDDPAKHLVATTRAERNERPVEVSTVLDERTGEVTTVVTTLPSEWLSAQTKTELWAEYGMKLPQREMVTRVGVNHQLVKVKDVAVGVTASVASDREAYVGLRASLRLQ